MAYIIILLSNKEYPKLKQKEGNKATIYSIIFANFLTLSNALKSKITTEPKAPRRKFNKIIPFWAFDSESNKKLNIYVTETKAGPLQRYNIYK